MIDIGTSPRVLITRLSAIGDCIHTLPLVGVIRERLPRAHIAWVTQPAAASLISAHPALDEVITVPRDWYRSWRSIVRIRQQLKRRCFDMTIDPQSLTKSSLLAYLSGARHRIGFARGQAREISPLLNTWRVQPVKTHVVERYLELLRPIGITSPPARFNLPVCPEARGKATEFLKREKLVDFALLNPGAGWDSKRWPHENYAAVARHLMMAHRLPSVVLWSGDRERAWAEQIVASAGGAAHLASDTPLRVLAALCAQARLFVGSDTGPLHLAAAMNTPCVGMYGPTRVCDCGPYGEGHQPLQAFHQGGTGRERRGTDNRAMRAISVNSVNTACDRIVAWLVGGDQQQLVA